MRTTYLYVGAALTSAMLVLVTPTTATAQSEPAPTPNPSGPGGPGQYANGADLTWRAVLIVGLLLGIALILRSIIKGR